MAGREAGFWRENWFYAGLSAALPHPGDILPFTLAEAGLHVERLPDGGLAARLNRAQQGGCLTIPQQCHGGTQLRCPQAACAFSRDRHATITPETPEHERLLRQFLGNRPEQLPTVALREEGGFIRLAMSGSAAPPEPAPRLSEVFPESWWREMPLPWHAATHHLVHASAGAARLHFPNLVLNAKAAIILQPLGPRLTRLRIAACGPRIAVEAWADAALERAAARPDEAPRQTIGLLPAATPPALRPSPHWGFLRG